MILLPVSYLDSFLLFGCFLGDSYDDCREAEPLSHQEPKQENPVDSDLELLKTLTLPDVRGELEGVSLDVACSAKQIAKRLFEPLHAQVGIDPKEGQYMLTVRFQDMPEGVSLEEIQCMIDEHTEINSVPVEYKVVGIARLRE